MAAIALLPGPLRTQGRATSPPPAPPAAPEVPAGPAAAPARPWWRRAVAVVRTSAGRAMKLPITDVAASLAYYAFLAIPAVLLVAVGVFGLVAGEDDALTLIDDTLSRVTRSSGSSAGLAVVGLVIAAWTASGAMSALMRGLNRVHGREETRSFARQRLTAAGLLAWSLLAAAVSFGLLVLGAPLSEAVGEAVGAESAVSWIWWAAQWPILAGALYVAVAGILRAGPSGAPGSRRAVLAGAGVTVAIWLAASGLFGVYVSRFGHYGAAWGSLSAVIVIMTWLWLTALAVLLGAQVEVEIDGSAGR